MKKSGAFAALAMVWVWALFGAVPGEGAEKFWLVTRHIAPVMRSPGTYTAVEDGRGIQDQEGIEACVYYGSRVTVAPVSGKHGAQWVKLMFHGSSLGYVEKEALVPFPSY
ncbi:MAG TPA: hypothetical protein PK393_05920, partial [Synergistaceae bacterium]|nr:hypothetical protein [Synergistaceae bacterium]